MHLVEIHAIIYSHILDELMYDDYDFDYTYTNDYVELDLDHDGQDLEEEYARDSHDYNELAYRHYA